MRWLAKELGLAARLVARVLGVSTSAARGILQAGVNVLIGRPDVSLPLIGILVGAFAASAGSGSNPARLLVPSPVAEVETRSGAVTRRTPVVLGMERPIDVDDRRVGGKTAPDVRVQLGFAGRDSKGRDRIVPALTVRREAQAVQDGVPSAPVAVTTRLDLIDALRPSRPVGAVSWTVDTGTSGRIPPRVTARLLGPLKNGFLAPFRAEVLAPGAEGPLELRAAGKMSGGPRVTAAARVSSMPDKLEITQSGGASSDLITAGVVQSGGDPAKTIDFAGSARWGNGQRAQASGVLRNSPRSVSVRLRRKGSASQLDVRSDKGKRPVHAEVAFRHQQGSETRIDGRLLATGLPGRLTGSFDRGTAADGGQPIDVNVKVPGTETIGRLHLTARNWLGAAPVPKLRPPGHQWVAVLARPDAGGTLRWQASAQLAGIRRAQIAERDGRISVLAKGDRQTDPLHVLADVDTRRGVRGSHARAGLRIAPRPATAQAAISSERCGRNLELSYAGSQPVDARGQMEVSQLEVCGLKRNQHTAGEIEVDRAPKRIDVAVPAGAGGEYRLSHSETDPDLRPDVRARAERVTGEGSRATRLAATLDARGLPPEMRGLVSPDAESGAARAVEFQACDFSAPRRGCADAAEPVRALRFTLDQGDTAGLPSPPSLGDEHVAVVQRHDRVHVEGAITDLSRLAVADRPLDDAGRPDGGVGVEVWGRGGRPFAVVVDGMDRTGTARTRASIDRRPDRLAGCLRPSSPVPAAGDAGQHPLVAPCARRDVLSGSSGAQLPATPLSLRFEASDGLRLDVDQRTSDARGEQRVGLNTDVPRRLRADVLPQGGQNPLELAVDGSAPVDGFDLDLRQRPPADPRWSRGDAFQARDVAVRAESVPGQLSGRLLGSGRSTEAVGLHACRLDFADGTCEQPPQPIGRLDVTARAAPARAGLPPVDEPEVGNGLEVLARGDRWEVTGGVSGLRQLVLRQEPPAGDALPSGPVGLVFDRDGSSPFAVKVDRRDPDTDIRDELELSAASLDGGLRACVQLPSSRPSTGAAAEDAVLGPCAAGEVLGEAIETRSSLPFLARMDVGRVGQFTARASQRRRDACDGGAARQVDVDASISNLEGTAQLAAQPGPHCSEPAADRDLRLDYRAEHEIAGLDVGVDSRRIDGTPSERDAYSRIEARDLPRALGGWVRTRGGATERVELHACPYSFAPESEGCEAAPDRIGALEVLARARRQRGELPPPPENLPARHLVSWQRAGTGEMRAAIGGLRSLSYRQRTVEDDDPPPGAPAGARRSAGTVGVRAEVEGNEPLRLVLDQVTDPAQGGGESATKLDVDVPHMPERFTACVRSPDGAAPRAPDAPDLVLEHCEHTEVEGHHGPLDTTPLSLYAAGSEPVAFTGSLEQRGPRRCGPGEQRTELDLGVAELPTRMRADVITSTQDRASCARVDRDLEAYLDAAEPIDRIDLGLASRRDDARCLDQRAERAATCVRGTLRNLGTGLVVHARPNVDDGWLRIDHQRAAADAPKPSLEDLSLQISEPDRAPLIVTGRVEGLTDHLTTTFARGVIDGKRTLTELLVDTCTAEQGPGCAQDRLDSVDLRATNVAVAGLLGGIAPLTAPDGVRLVERDGDFDLHTRTTRLQRFAVKRRDAGGAPTRTLQAGLLRAPSPSGARSGDAQVVVDSEGSQGYRKLRARVKRAPSVIDFCLRDRVDAAYVAEHADSGVPCDAEPADRLAVRGAIGAADLQETGDSDVEIEEFSVSGAFTAQALRGSAAATGVKSGVVRLVSKRTGRPDALVETRNFEGQRAEIADRIEFKAATVPYDRPLFTTMRGTTPPDEDPRNDDQLSDEDRLGWPEGKKSLDGNWAIVERVGDDHRFAGAIDGVRAIGVRPEACGRMRSDGGRDPDPRFPPRPGIGEQPEYSCLEVDQRARNTVGFAVRSRDFDGNVTRIEDGLLTSGADGTTAVTLASVPAALAREPWCSSTRGMPCRPPMLATERPAGEAPTFTGLLVSGPESLVNQLGKVKVNEIDGDDVLVDYGVDPADEPLGQMYSPDCQSPFGEQLPPDICDSRRRASSTRGIKVKVGASAAGVAVRVRASLTLPRHMTFAARADSCAREIGHVSCSDDEIDPEKLESATDIDVKLIRANQDPERGDAGRLGIGALVHDFDTGRQVTLLGGREFKQRSPEWEGYFFIRLAGAFSHENYTREKLAYEPLEAPGHLDLRTAVRYDAEDLASAQHGAQTYVQVDGRLNEKIDPFVHLNRPDVPDNETKVIQARLKDAPGREGVSGFTGPSTFRTRIDYTSFSPRWRLNDIDRQIEKLTCDRQGVGYDTPYASACRYLTPPGAYVPWADLEFDHTLDEPGEDDPTFTDDESPAREIDVVMRHTPLNPAAPVKQPNRTQIEVRAFKEVTSLRTAERDHQLEHGKARIDWDIRLVATPVGGGFRTGSTTPLLATVHMDLRAYGPAMLTLRGRRVWKSRIGRVADVWYVRSYPRDVICSDGSCHNPDALPGDGDTHTKVEMDLGVNFLIGFKVTHVVATLLKAKVPWVTTGRFTKGNTLWPLPVGMNVCETTGFYGGGGLINVAISEGREAWFIQDPAFKTSLVAALGLQDSNLLTLTRSAIKALELIKFLLDPGLGGTLGYVLEASKAGWCAYRMVADRPTMIEELVTTSGPAPRGFGDRLPPGSEDEDPPTPAATNDDTAPGARTEAPPVTGSFDEDLTIQEEEVRTLCGVVRARKFTVKWGGTARVGADTEPGCDGTLSVEAREISVEGIIDADAAITQPAVGSPVFDRCMREDDTFGICEQWRTFDPGGSLEGLNQARSTQVRGLGHGGGYGGPGGKGNQHPLHTNVDAGSYNAGSTGSPGGFSNRGAAGGAGGGMVDLTANIVRLTGTIRARGARGRDEVATFAVPGFATGCSGGAASGGGSGGALTISSNWLGVGDTDGEVDVSGGRGGDVTPGVLEGSGAWGGGGGARGRVTIKTAHGRYPDGGRKWIHAKGGSGGHGNCGDGEAGSGDPPSRVADNQELEDGAPVGPLTGGVEIDGYTEPIKRDPPWLLAYLGGRSPEVEVDIDDPETFFVRDVVIVCHAYAPSGAPGGLGSPELEIPESFKKGFEELRELGPTGTDNSTRESRTLAMTNGHNCFAVKDLKDTADPSSDRGIAFDLANVADQDHIFGKLGPSPQTIESEYTKDGFHSVFAVAVQLRGDKKAYVMQEDLLPEVRYAVDSHPPTIAAEALGGTNCFPNLRCFNAADTLIETEVRATDGISGVDTFRCGWREDINGQTHMEPCPESGIHSFGFSGRGEIGFYAEAEDKLGNDRDRTRYIRAYRDKDAPTSPALTLIGGEQSNGWYREPPELHVMTMEEVQDLPFTEGAIRLVLGEEERRCGTHSEDSQFVVVCRQPVTELVGEHGVFELGGYAVDRVGNRSPDAPITTVRLDSEPPVAELALAPEQPTGEGGWYRAAPAIHFNVADRAGGSGVDLTGSTPPSGIRFAIDPGPEGVDGGDYREYRPDQTVRVPDGVHEVCWDVWDRAANRQVPTHGAKGRCETVKVDTAPPAIDIRPLGSLEPVRPRPRPLVTVTDEAPGSGLADDGLIRVSIDGSPFVEGGRHGFAPEPPTATRSVLQLNQVADGAHEVCVYARDMAGNVGGNGTGGVRCETYRVAEGRPSAPQIAFDPERPDLPDGSYREPPSVAFAAHDVAVPATASWLGLSELLGDADDVTYEYTVNGAPAPEAWEPAGEPVALSGTGALTVCARARNARGRLSDEACRTVRVAGPPPSGALDPGMVAALDAADDGWSRRSVSVPVRPRRKPDGSLVEVDIRMDGGPWETVSTGERTLELTDGVHVIEARERDTTGATSPSRTWTVRVDTEAPSGRATTYPSFDPGAWLRTPPAIVATVDDPGEGSGPGAASITRSGATGDAGATARAGTARYVVRPRDVAGNRGAESGVTWRLDPDPPQAVIVSVPASPVRSGKAVPIRYEAVDARSGFGRAVVEIFSAEGDVVRRYPLSVKAGKERLRGKVRWDQRDSRGRAVSPGAYYARMAVGDRAGNTALSADSRTVTISTGGRRP